MSGEITFGEYQAAAHDSSLLHQFSDPQQKIHDGFLEESIEVFYNANNITQFAYLFGYVIDVNDDVKTQITKEAGDALWYVAENITREGRCLNKIAASAVARHTDSALAEPYTITDFDALAAAHAPNYSVINFKLAAHLRTSTYSEAYVAKHTIATLQSSAGYVLQRVFGRLRRQLLTTSEPSGPASNIDFENPELLEQSEEDFLWVVSGLAQAKLGVGLAEIATANLSKLARRKAEGTLLSGDDVDRS